MYHYVHCVFVFAVYSVALLFDELELELVDRCGSG